MHTQTADMERKTRVIGPMRGFGDISDLLEGGADRETRVAISRVRGAAHIAFMAAFAVLITIVAWPAVLFGRDAALRVIRIWARGSLLALRLLCGIRYRVEGEENLPQGGTIVAANHQSMWETVAFFALLPRASMVFKDSLLKVPVYGWWGVKSGSIPVDRQAGPQSIRHLMRAARVRIEDGFQLVIFPEGTRISPGARAPLQPGVAAIYLASGAPVTPAVHDSGLYWRHPGRERRPGVITLRFLPPIPPGLDRASFEKRLEAAMLGARRDLFVDLGNGAKA